MGQFHNSPSSTLTDTPEPPTPTATLISDDWTSVVYDKFVSESDNWITGDSDSELATWNTSISDGIFLWDAKAKSGFIGWNVFQGPVISDFLLGVDIKKLSAPQSANYGLIFRMSGNNYYTFRISENTFWLDLHRDDGWMQLIYPTTSPIIKPDEKNRLAVLAIGTHFTFYINNQYVAEFDNNLFSTGTVAICIGLPIADTQGVLEFDNFELRTP